MPSKTFTQSISGGSVSISNAVTRTADGDISIEPTVNTAKALSSWTKSSGTEGGGNLAPGHGWSSGKGDVYWTGGRRYDVDVTISTDAVTLAAGSGNDYPANADATVVLAMHKEVNCAIDGDLLEIIGFCFASTTANSTARGHIHAEDVGAAVIADLDFDANEPRVWDIDAGQTNTFTGNPITKLYITMDSATETVTLQVSGLQDVTP